LFKKKKKKSGIWWGKWARAGLPRDNALLKNIKIKIKIKIQELIGSVTLTKVE
jgi:hypothetical protein